MGKTADMYIRTARIKRERGREVGRDIGNYVERDRGKE